MAVKVNEYRQRVIDANKALDALQDEQGAARATYAGLLDRAARGVLADDEKPKLEAAAAAVAGFDARLSAQRKIANLASEELHAEEERLAREDADLERKPSGRIRVEDPNHTKDPRRGFTGHRDFLSAVMRIGRRGVDAADERIRPLLVRDKDDEQANGEAAVLLPLAFTPKGVRAAAGSDEQGEYDDRYGGFTVPTTRLPGLLQVGFEGDPTAGLTQGLPMASPSVEIAARVDKNHTSSVSGGFSVSRKPETVAGDSSRVQFEMVTMKAAGMFGVAYATEYLLTDSPQSFVAIIDQGFRSQFGAAILNEKIRGGGGNEYLGVLNSGCLVTVAAEGGQVADTINSENVIKMAAQSWGFGSSIWLANHDTRPQLIKLSILVGTGGTLIYQPSATMGFPDMLLGRPIYYSEYASKLGDVGDLILGNWSQFLEGIYQPLQSAESMHVRFLNHERTFKFWLRNAGAPWWRSALTPNKSSATLSPFVTLAAR